MRKALLLLTLVSSAFGQLPDAPKPQLEINPYSGHRVLGWKETASGKQFWVPYGAFWAASVFDAEVTHAGIAHHVCVEGNQILPSHPSRGQLYREMAIENVPVTALAFFLRKAGFRWWTYEGPAVYGTVIHVKGAAGWLGRCW